MNCKKVLENSIYWQRHVFTYSREPKQKERAKKAIEKLTKELEMLSHAVGG